MSSAGLDELRALVIDDPSLRNELLSVGDGDTFAAKVVDMAQRNGIELSVDEVSVALRAERRRRFERWV